MSHGSCDNTLILEIVDGYVQIQGCVNLDKPLNRFATPFPHPWYDSKDSSDFQHLGELLQGKGEGQETRARRETKPW